MFIPVFISINLLLLCCRCCSCRGYRSLRYCSRRQSMSRRELSWSRKSVACHWTPAVAVWKAWRAKRYVVFSARLILNATKGHVRISPSLLFCLNIPSFTNLSRITQVTGCKNQVSGTFYFIFLKFSKTWKKWIFVEVFCILWLSAA